MLIFLQVRGDKMLSFLDAHISTIKEVLNAHSPQFHRGGKEGNKGSNVHYVKFIIRM